MDASSTPVFQIIPGDALSAAEKAEVIALCDRAYGEPIASYYAQLRAPVHIIGRVDGVVVTHGLWVTRWLQAGDGPLLRTAYVELVATDPARAGRGHASAVMRRLAQEFDAFELAALCPSDAAASLYERVGWRYWRGPLSIRHGDRTIPTPEERVMLLSLPRTPALDFDAPLSAEWREGELW